MKVAVAFIGRQKWSDLFQDYRGKVQVICWLDTVNTDPYAVEGMKEQRDKFEVKQIDSMHAKVYLAPGAAAVVGSANLSTPALANSTSGQHEAAVLVRRREIVNEIGQWFDEKWRSEARDITPDDFARAKAKYDAARAARSDNLDSIRLVGGPTKPGMADAVVTSAADSSMQGPVSSTDDVTVPQFTPISTMPMSPVDGRPLYRGGDVADVFMFVAHGATKREIRARARTEHTIEYLFNRHSTPEGYRGVRWDIVIDHRMTPYTPDWFDALPDPTRVRFVNARKSPVFVNSKHPRGQNYSTDRALSAMLVNRK